MVRLVAVWEHGAVSSRGLPNGAGLRIPGPIVPVVVSRGHPAWGNRGLFRQARNAADDPDEEEDVKK